MIVRENGRSNYSRQIKKKANDRERVINWLIAHCTTRASIFVFFARTRNLYCLYLDIPFNEVRIVTYFR